MLYQNVITVYSYTKWIRNVLNVTKHITLFTEIIIYTFSIKLNVFLDTCTKSVMEKGIWLYVLGTFYIPLSMKIIDNVSTQT